MMLAVNPSPFSTRIHWDLRPNSLSLALEQKRRAGAKILDLTESNPTRANIEYPGHRMLAAFFKSESLRYEPAAQGLLSTRKAVAESLTPRPDPERMLLTASTSEAYSYLFKLLADPGDELLVPRPSYPLFDFLAALEGVRVVQYPLHYFDGWALDIEALRQAVTPRSKAIVLVNPNNPTGSFLKRGELEDLIVLCGEHNLALISDEVFSDYAFGPDPERVSTIADVDQVLTFAMGGLSKMAGLPQMKLGWIIVNGPEAICSEALNRLELIADTFLSVSTPIQQAAPSLIELKPEIQGQIRRRCATNLASLDLAIGSAPEIERLRVEGGWYATLRMPRTRSEEELVLDLLEHENILVQPGFFYDFESEVFLIVSLLTPEQEFTEGIRRIVEGSGII